MSERKKTVPPPGRRSPAAPFLPSPFSPLHLDRPPVHIGLPLYPAGHSLLVFLVVFGIATILARRIVFEMLGWLLHILIDIPTHSFSYYATTFLWPVSDYRVDGIAWWTPWFWTTTYGALGVVYFWLWKRGWMSS